MNRRLILSFGLGALFVARAAFAQDVSIGYQGLPYKSSGESENGIQVGEGILMHVGAGAEAGYDSNVFYQDSSTPRGLLGAAILRVNSFVDVTNTTRTGIAPSGLSFGVRAGILYRRYESSDDRITGYSNAFMPSAGVSVGSVVAPTVSLGFSDGFLRMEDPPYNPGQAPISRDNNQASAEIRWSPGGGRINNILRYTNMVDIFESADLAYANSLSQDLMLDVSWKWLPKTALFVQGRQGYVTYLDSAGSRTKASSFPLHISAGLRGLITEKTSALIVLGYTNAFYSCSGTSNVCTNPAGLYGLTEALVQLSYRPTLLSRVVLGYRHGFQNSVISTFYYNETVFASYVQQIAGRFAADLSGSYSHKTYEGFVPFAMGGSVPRSDNFFQVGLTGDYFLRNWAYVGVGYSLVANTSDYTIPPSPNGGLANSVAYVKHQVFARLGINY